MSDRVLHLSASAIGAFLACPMRFAAKYIHGVRKSDQTVSQRRGTNWHELLEIVGMVPEQVCFFCANQMYPDSDCPVCSGTGHLVGDSIDAAMRMLDFTYRECPNTVDMDDWLTERAKLFYSLSAYKWYWGIGEEDQDYKVIATEVPFNMTVINPASGRTCRDVRLVGKIDKIVQFEDGMFGQMEHKSTTKPIGDDSEYWNHLKMDIQTTLYPYAMLRMQKQGELEHLGIMPDSPIATKVLYDAYHVPQTKMKKLSFADTRKFVKTGEYLGTEFDIVGASLRESVRANKKENRKAVKAGTIVGPDGVRVDGHPVKIVKGANDGDINFVETEGMYGTRVFTDIVTSPDTYFNRREISRSVEDMAKFERKLHAMYKTILMMRRTDGFWEDGTQCEATFRCDYTKYCWHNEVISPDNLLEGFECIFRKDEDDGNAQV